MKSREGKELQAELAMGLLDGSGGEIVLDVRAIQIQFGARCVELIHPLLLLLRKHALVCVNLRLLFTQPQSANANHERDRRERERERFKGHVASGFYHFWWAAL